MFILLCYSTSQITWRPNDRSGFLSLMGEFQALWKFLASVYIRGGGAQNTFLYLHGVPAGLITYASMSGKTFFKFRFDVFWVGSQNFNIMCQGRKSWSAIKLLKLIVRGHQIYISTRVDDRNRTVFSVFRYLCWKKVIRVKHFLEKWSFDSPWILINY